MLSQKAFRHKNVLILGFGKSGQSAKNLLQNICNNIFVWDQKFLVRTLKNKKENKNDCFLSKNNYLENKNNIFLQKKVFFEHDLNSIIKNQDIHFCIVSPGISVFSKEIKKIKSKGIQILSELELGAIFCKGKIFAISGTNGKTTTANLLYQIFATAKKHCFLCGNVGTPITQIAPQTTNRSLIVCEISSFQMETTKSLPFFASALLNVRPDHLDRHKNMANYVFEKEKIFANCHTKKFFCFNDKISFLLSKKFYNAIYFSFDSKIIKNDFELIKQNNLVGKFNLSNIACAVALAKCANIKKSTIKKAVQNFRGLKHRLYFIAKHQHISFINDSKATNPASTIFALESINQKTILLLGGSSKNLDFADLAKKEIFCVVAFGESKNKILQDFSNKQNVFEAKNLQDAFLVATKFALQIAEEVCILLSPACASFDEFTSYAHRGEEFEKMVQAFIATKS